MTLRRGQARRQAPIALNTANYSRIWRGEFAAVPAPQRYRGLSRRDHHRLAVKIGVDGMADRLHQRLAPALGLQGSDVLVIGQEPHL